jgi:hypothetical protein
MDLTADFAEIEYPLPANQAPACHALAFSAILRSGISYVQGIAL